MTGSREPHSQNNTAMAKARASAMGSLAMREHSVQELKEKLLRKNHDEHLVEALLQELQSANYVSDARFAESFWRSRSNRGYGPQRIRRELQMKGVSDELISDGLFEADIDFLAILVGVYEKKYHGKPCADRKELSKRQGFLYRRGFSQDLIKEVLNGFDF